VLSSGYSRCALNLPFNEVSSCLTRFLHSLPSRTSRSNSVAKSIQYVLPLQVATRMQKRQPRLPASLRAQGNHAVALYDPKRIENRQPPGWWNDGIVDVLSRIAEWIAGRMIIFTVLFIIKILFMVTRGFLY